MRLEGIGKLKKFHDLIGSLIHRLPSCIIVPQPTKLLHANDYFAVGREIVLNKGIDREAVDLFPD
jgi:hypothetical protein